MKKESNYKQGIQDKVNQVEFDYNASDWNALSKQLPSKSFPVWTKIAIGTIIISIISLVVYFGIQQDHTIPKNVTEVAAKNQRLPKDQVKDEAVQTNSTKEEQLPITEKVAEKTIKKEAELEKTKSIVNNPTSDEKTVDTTPIKNDDSKGNKDTYLKKPELIVSFNKVCVGESITLVTKPEMTNNQYITFNGKRIKTDDKKLTFEKSGANTIQLFENNEVLDEVIMEVYDRPVATFAAIKQDEEFSRINYLLEANTHTNAGYLWKINDLEVGNKQQVNHTFKRKGNAKVTLETYSSQGCTAISEQIVAIEESFDLLSYDAFTPDGDGLNDEFIPKALEANNLKFTMTIYTVSGIELYSTNDYYQPWNGRRNNNGEKMSPGVYLWKVSVYDDENQIHPFSGQIKIVKLR